MVRVVQQGWRGSRSGEGFDHGRGGLAPWVQQSPSHFLGLQQAPVPLQTAATQRNELFGPLLVPLTSSFADLVTKARIEGTRVTF